MAGTEHHDGRASQRPVTHECCMIALINQSKMLSPLFQDLRYGLRLLAKSPAISINAIVTLALAIGANSAVFSVVNSVLLRPLPFADPERLVMIWQTNPHEGHRPDRVAWRDIRFWREQSTAFENIGTFSPYTGTFLGEAEAQRIVGCRITSSLFPLLRVAPRLGRLFLPEEDLPGARPVALLSDGFWRRAFGADPAIVGKSIRLSGRSVTVTGVMPPEFHFPSKAITTGWGFLSGEADVFEPLILSPQNALATYHIQLVIARLKPGVAAAKADAEMKLIARRLEQQYPESNAGWGASVAPMMEQVVSEARGALLVFAGAVTFVLLIACANVASLLLVRNAARQKELAIRRALGAEQGRLLRQLLTESVLLSLAGGALGLFLAYGAVHALVAIGPESLPRLEEIHVDGRALAFTLLVSISTGLLCGLIPAWQTRGAAPYDVLKSEGRSASGSRGRIRAQQALVAAEIAMSMLLLAGAGLLLRSYLRLERVDPGFRAAGVLSLQLTAPPSKYPKPEQIAAFFQQVTSRIAALPGVKAVGGISAPPFTALADAFPIHIEDHPETLAAPRTVVGLYGVTSGYFAAMGIPLERGRLIADSDQRGATLVAVISRSLAERFWPGQDPIGKRLKVEAGLDNPWMTIAGIAGDVRFKSLDAPATLAVYHAQAQMTWRPMAFAVRTDTPPTALISAIRREVAAIDREQPVYNMVPLETMLGDSIAKPRFHAQLILCFAGLALALAVVGAYGVMSYSVSQRTQEIGIRMALGASQAGVLRMILRQGITIALIGCVAGLAGALACGRVIAGFLFQTAPADPVVLAGISVLLLGSTVIASFIPARRATRVDPMAALREN
jgi:putative ABC transport system permease protein